MVDYSKWKNIEISDDEDDVHPNIDTPSLFRWRHQARVERMEELEKEKQRLQKEKDEHIRVLKEVKGKFEKGEGDKQNLERTLADLEKKSNDLSLHEQTLKSQESKTPWNVDTISAPVFSKTIINKDAIRPVEESLSEDELEQRMKKFVRENEKLLKQYGMLRKFEDSKRFLMEHQHLACENTANYLAIWCINLEMEQKSELMAHVAHQTICMQFLLDLSKQLDVNPRACVSSFFSKIQIAEQQYKDQFDGEVTSFIERIRKRAAEKVQDAIDEAEEEQRLARLGPGGLDPVEVFETLPPVLQQCFESRDLSALQDAIATLPVEEAKYHMKRCVDSGMWVPGGGDDKDEDGDAAAGDDDEGNKDDEDEEDIYHEASTTMGDAAPPAAATQSKIGDVD